MKRLSLLLFILLALPLVATADDFTVASNPLWTNTGISLSPGQIVTITYISGSWTWQTGQGPFDGAGDYQPGLVTDEWITNSYHAQLIGYAGPGNPNDLPRIVAQDDLSLFAIGNSITIGGLTGTLWLGMNDDYATNAIGDNEGSLLVRVAVPEPTSLLLLGTGLGALGLIGFRRRKM